MLTTPARRLLAGVVAAAGFAAVPADGHVIVLSPNGGETLLAGSRFEIEWEIAIPHNLEHWDVYYARDLGPQNWVPIVLGHEAGDPAIGSIHTYSWTVPDFVDESVWVRVVMVNDTASYQDNSNGSFSIVPAPPVPLGLVMVVFCTSTRRRSRPLVAAL